MKSKIDVARAWRDPEYRASLTDEERASLPESPAGAVDLSTAELESVNGGTWWWGCTKSAVCKAATETGIDCCIQNHNETLLLA